MATTDRYNEQTDHYELGVEVDGQFVPLVQVPGEQVRATAANLNTAAEAEQAAADAAK